MAGFFSAGSSQCLTQSSNPVPAYPYTVGVWFQTTATSPATSATVWAFAQTAGAGNNNAFYQDTSNNLNFWDGGNVTTIQASISTGIWYFGLCRCISGTNKRFSLLSSRGAVSHAQDTTSSITTGMTNAAIGSSSENNATLNYFTGYIAEFWLTNADVQADGAQTSEPTLWQLAYSGPFSVPHIAQNIIDYRSLRSSLGSDQDRGAETYAGANGRQVWTSNGSPTLGPHPPLFTTYAPPPQRGVARRPLWVPPPKILTRRRALYLR